MNIDTAAALLVAMLGIVCTIVFTNASTWFHTDSLRAIKVYPALLFPPDSVVHMLIIEFKHRLYEILTK